MLIGTLIFNRAVINSSLTYLADSAQLSISLPVNVSTDDGDSFEFFVYFDYSGTVYDVGSNMLNLSFATIFGGMHIPVQSVYSTYGFRIYSIVRIGTDTLKGGFIVLYQL